MKKLVYCFTLLLTALGCGNALAQDYPNKPIRVIVGFPAGTAVDVVMRALSVHMQKSLGQPLVVETRPGAGGAIAVNAVARSPADGYTLHFGVLAALTPALVINSVDARKELAPISNSVTSPFLFFVSGKLPVKSLPELVSYAKANPQGLNFATSTGLGQMLMQLLKNSHGIGYTLINYAGAPAIVTAMLAGDVHISISVFGPYEGSFTSGAIRALFVMAPKRLARYPEIPTAAEVGIPNVEAATSDIGLWAPRGTATEITDKVGRSSIVAVRMPDITDLLLKQGYQAVASSPEEQLRTYDAAVKFWTDAARVTNFKPQ